MSDPCYESTQESYRVRAVWADPRVRFGVLCLIWGLTWIPVSIGVAAVPPMLFAGSRFFLAGALLMAVCWARGEAKRDPPARLAAVTFFTVTATYAPMFWGFRYVPSALGGVLNFSLTPVTLLVLSILAREEKFSTRQAGAILLGIAGLAVLLRPSSLGGAWGLAGAAGVVIGTVAYCLGAVLARPLLRRTSPTWLLGTTSFAGGASLLILSWLFEARVDVWQISTVVWLSWWALLIFATLLGSLIFYQLLRDWGASKAGTYAFISPVISVLAGLAFGEHLTGVQIIGMACLFAATVVTVTGRSQRSSGDFVEGEDENA